MKLAEDWSEREGIPIVENLSDLGLSASTGTHLKKGDLGQWLKVCESEEMKQRTSIRDVYLLVESLDRLSRQKIMIAVGLLAQIVDAGVKVVTLIDGQVYTRESMNDLGQLIISISVMSRAYEEIKSKSKRIAEAYDAKKVKAKKDGKPFGGKVPYCFKLNAAGTKYVINPEPAKIVRRIFRMASEGYTYSQITRIFNKEKIPTFGTMRGKFQKGKLNPTWQASIIRQILLAKYPIGIKETCTARLIDGVRVVKKGEDIPNQFPPIVSEELWAKARRNLVTKQGQPKKKRSGKISPNLFTHIAFDMNHGDTMIYFKKTRGPENARRKQKGLSPRLEHAYLVPRGVLGGRSGNSWRLDEFEKIFFSSISRALDVEGSAVRDEEDLARIEAEIEETERRKGKWMDLHEDDDPDPDILARIKKYREVISFKQTEADSVREKIRAGYGRTSLDPSSSDRETLRRAVRANVERLDLDCDKKKFRCLLKNGIDYEGQINEDGSFELSSSHKDLDFSEFSIGEMVA
tara:strand:- start:952 stop:2508 length:1557 start_codon:yes stop_codon:yes gene_type:complete